MKRYTVIAMLTAAFLMVAAVALFIQLTSGFDLPLTVTVTAGAQAESIRCWTNEDGQIYVFLPSYADMTRTMFHTNTAESIEIGGHPVADGMHCSIFQLNTPYEITYKAWGKTHIGTITFIQSANIAAMYIDTESGTMDYIHHEKGNEETGTLRLYSAEGELGFDGRLESINGRGNFTWEAFEKKPYSIRLAEEADLLGMGQAQRWILLANADDPSNLRNKFVYDFANDEAMVYSPDSQWVDLYLNGEYAGLYLLSERNEVHSQRVVLEQEGSFLVSLELKERLDAQNYPHVVMKSGQALRVHYPAKASYEIKEMLRGNWQSIENAILADDGIDPESGASWLALLDLDSWVKKYLIEEIFGNADACFISQYFYRNGSNGKVYAGPVWDFDHSLGSLSSWQFENARTFLANRYHVKDGFDSPWFYQLYQKDEFYNRITELYQQEFLPLLSEYLGDRIDQYAAIIQQASAVNQLRWGVAVDVNSEVQLIKEYMGERIDFLNSLWIDGKEFCQVQADHSLGGFYAYYAVVPGECLPELPVFEDTETSRFIGWYYVNSGEPVDMTQPVYEDMEIYAKWVDSPAKKVDQVIKLIPLAVIALLGVCLLTAEVQRSRKGW